MTAEAAVMNRIGVALAADSAVTMGSGADKVYISAEKLFQLSPSAPVGVMVYGNAAFMRLPWETIIKSYRNQLGPRRFRTVEDYASGLLGFLTRNEILFPKQLERNQIELLVMLHFVHLREKIRGLIDEEIKQREPPLINDTELPPIIERAINGYLETVKQADRIESISQDDYNISCAVYSELVDDLVKKVFDGLPIHDAAKETLRDLAFEMLTRQHFGALDCGLVIAGFGDDEFLPALHSYELEEMVNGIPRLKKGYQSKIGIDNDASIRAFAQQDPVHHFLQGVDAALYSLIRSSTEGIVNGVVSLILDKVKAADEPMSTQLQSVVHPEVGQIIQSLFQEWDNARKRYWEPVLEIASVLPKDELAAMAEALVNLTKFRRKVSRERETVGGPIDVAVITKGDGFVWIRRKHYFDAGLNPRVMSRLSKEA
jgi:hypothetical protein